MHIRSDISSIEKFPRVFTFEMRQDDPSKCTSAKMRKLGLARPVTKNAIPADSIVLNPSSQIVLIFADRETALTDGLVVIDCSWEKSAPIFQQKFRGQPRRLPALLAGNPTNYSKLGRLSSVEAVSAGLYIMGFEESARKFVSIYKWGETFLSLNQDPLDDYRKATSPDEIRILEKEYFPYLASQ